MNNDQYYVPFFKVKINNKTLAQAEANCIKSLTINDVVEEGADTFTLSVANHDLRWIDKKPFLFAEGNEVFITYGYVGGKTADFLGEITKVEVDFPADGSSSLTVTGYDLIRRLMRGNTTKSHTNTMVSVIVAEMALKNQLIPMVAPSDFIKSDTQTFKSDYEFIKEHAERLKYEFRAFKEPVTGLNILLFKPALDTRKEVAELEWMKSLISFSPKINTADQVNEVEIRGYDPKLKQEIKKSFKIPGWAKSIMESKAKNLVSNASGGESKISVVTEDFKNPGQLIKMAESVMQRLTDKLVTGSGSCIGMPQVKAGSVIKLGGLGSRFSGAYYVKSSTHSISESGYTTNFEVTKRS